MLRKLDEQYSPLYFLAALGTGGLSISFYMYLMFMTKHQTPLATFDSLYPLLMQGTLSSLLIVGAMVAIAFFALQHFRLLLWNILEYRHFKRTVAYANLKKSNQEVTLMAMPLTYAMSVNVVFIMGATFVPGLWQIVEYLFPLAVLAFLVIGAYALKLFGAYFVRVLMRGEFDFVKNNHLSQMLAIFAFAMVAVGLAAPMAMSHTPAVMAVAMFGVMFFLVLSLMLMLLKLSLGFKSMMQQGVALEAAPSLWMMIPILTLIGIAVVRLIFAISHHFLHIPMPQFNFGLLFVLMSGFISVQVLFGLLGYALMSKLNYFNMFIHGERKSPASYALICPGVAFFVFGMFFLFFGLVKSGFIVQFGLAYFMFMLPLVYVQYKTIAVLFKLNRKLLCDSCAEAIPQTA